MYEVGERIAQVGRSLLPDALFLAMAVRGEIAQLLALVEKKTRSEPLQNYCGSFGQLVIVTYNSFVGKNLMSSKIKPKINEDVFPLS